ncbi:MAG: hypothetical protein JRN68_07750 [Nitrososphaerota archaeon]|nr:hypothetical protein [Nitrososphaerota archaeon]
MSLDLFNSSGSLLSLIEDDYAIKTLAILSDGPKSVKDISYHLKTSKWSLYKTLQSLTRTNMVVHERGQYSITNGGRSLVAGIENVLRMMYALKEETVVIKKDEIVKLIKLARGYLRAAYLRGYLTRAEIKDHEAWLRALEIQAGVGPS